MANRGTVCHGCRWLRRGRSGLIDSLTLSFQMWGNRMRNTLDRLQARRRDDAGFTLIELLIVIVILGVLAAVVVFSVRGITDRGDESACKANLKTAETAVEAYYAKVGSNPASLAVLVPDYLKSDPSDSVDPGAVDAKVRVGYTAATGVVTPGTSCD
ncbi:hypothetical protein GCM10025786_09290 [Nocardioides caeni]